MKRFAELFTLIDATTRTNEKVAALSDYFHSAPPRDAAWALWFLTGNRFRRAVSHRQLRAWAADEAAIPMWLIDESYGAVGDLSETLALLLPQPMEARDLALHEVIEERIEPLAQLDEQQQRQLIVQTWRDLGAIERFLYHKLLIGEFRMGVAKTLVTRAMAVAAGVEQSIMAHRLMGEWSPTSESFRALFADDQHEAPAWRPYPFYLAYPLEAPVESLGEPTAWLAEWKWDGIRAQIIARGGERIIWSRGEEMINESFPELVEIARALPFGTVIDGEIVAWDNNAPLPFYELQKRLGRKDVHPMLFADVPICYITFDLLESDAIDRRNLPLSQRRLLLHEIVSPIDDETLMVTPTLLFATWEELARHHAGSREHRAEGIMLKHLESPYEVGRKRGHWWKWKIDPFTMDAVLIYAQLGTGRRASLYTDYTFGVWDHDSIVPVAKAYSGLTDEEIRALDRWIRNNTIERHGPVRAVKPELVFELAFENIAESDRHRSGIAVRFPRILRQRHDKPARDADSLDSLRDLLRAQRA